MAGNSEVENEKIGVNKMVQALKVFAATSGDLSSVPRTHMMEREN